MWHQVPGCGGGAKFARELGNRPPYAEVSDTIPRGARHFPDEAIAGGWMST